jgi:hypothetical protein
VPERLDPQLVHDCGEVLRGRLQIGQRGRDGGRVSARGGRGPERRDARDDVRRALGHRVGGVTIVVGVERR